MGKFPIIPQGGWLQLELIDALGIQGITQEAQCNPVLFFLVSVRHQRQRTINEELACHWCSCGLVFRSAICRLYSS